jgi:hypothetical protein
MVGESDVFDSPVRFGAGNEVLEAELFQLPPGGELDIVDEVVVDAIRPEVGKLDGQELVHVLPAVHAPVRHLRRDLERPAEERLACPHVVGHGRVDIVDAVFDGQNKLGASARFVDPAASLGQSHAPEAQDRQPVPGFRHGSVLHVDLSESHFEWIRW